MAGKLILLPCPIADDTVAAVLPPQVVECARGLDYFLVENAKSARAFLKAIGHPGPLRELQIVEIGHEPDAASIAGWLAPLQAGRDGALVSEAGCPAVADPGATLVAAAHRLGLRVQPRVGPSSLLLALMASGGSGQRFRFHGYLPVAADERARRLQALERDACSGETQLFIETPYRSPAMFDAILAACAPDTRLALAVALTAPDEYMRMLSIGEWRNTAAPPLARRPAVFLLMR